MERLPESGLKTPEQELVYLRAQVEAKERELAALKQEAPRGEIIRERIIHHKETPDEAVLHPRYQLPEAEAHALSLNLDPDNNDETIEELRRILETKGIRNALSVLEKLNSPHIEDDFHRFLVQYVAAGMPVKGLAEGEPSWKALHMTLYEIALPEPKKEESGMREKTLKELRSEERRVGKEGGS